MWWLSWRQRKWNSHWVHQHIHKSKSHSMKWKWFAKTRMEPKLTCEKKSSEGKIKIKARGGCCCCCFFSLFISKSHQQKSLDQRLNEVENYKKKNEQISTSNTSTKSMNSIINLSIFVWLSNVKWQKGLNDIQCCTEAPFPMLSDYGVGFSFVKLFLALTWAKTHSSNGCRNIFGPHCTCVHFIVFLFALQVMTAEWIVWVHS